MFYALVYNQVFPSVMTTLHFDHQSIIIRYLTQFIWQFSEHFQSLTGTETSKKSNCLVLFWNAGLQFIARIWIFYIKLVLWQDVKVMHMIFSQTTGNEPSILSTSKISANI